MDKSYRKFRLSKGNGKFRVIYSPNGDYKKALKSLVPSLNAKEFNYVDWINQECCYW